MTPPTPPFRADHVGSLLRPPELHETRAQARAGTLSVGQLRDVEDRCIRTAVARQESLGLRVVTDGELAATSGTSTSSAGSRAWASPRSPA
jgi:5-methyltetrahydropteroyltriglutamate--homocysteine methyltransferase